MKLFSEEEWDSSSSESSVYEEPEDAGSDEDIMVEIIRERLLNGWSGDEDSDTSLELEDLFSAPSEIENIVLVEKIEEVVIVVPEPEELKPVNLTQRSVGFEIKKTHIGPNGEILTTTKNIKWQSQLDPTEPKKKKAFKVPPPVTPPIPSNPWLALSAMKMNSSVLAGFGKKNSEKGAFNISSSPAAIRAFSESRKREMEKEMSTRNPSMSKAVEELGKMLSRQNSSYSSIAARMEAESHKQKEDESAMFEDIFDQDFFDVDQDLHLSDNDSIDFSRFARIPIGTFWNSQRNKSKVAKRRDIQRAIKRSSGSKILEATLMETLPRVKTRRKSTTLHNFFSPTLEPVALLGLQSTEETTMKPMGFFEDTIQPLTL